MFSLIVASTIGLGVLSCKKESLQPVEVPETEEVFKVNLFDKWELVDGWIYFENIETGQKTKLSHFGPNKTTSSIRYPYPWNGIEIIEKDQTTWEFRNIILGSSIYEFVLNEQDTMAYKHSSSYKSIIEHPQASSNSDMHLGGSTKPFSSWTEDGVNIKIMVHKAYTTIDNYNYKYFNVLEFKPQ